MSSAGRPRVRVLITREANEGRPVARALAALDTLDAELVCVPVIRFAAPRDTAPLQAAADRLDTYDWVAFTSFRGAEALLALHPLPWPHPPSIAMVGRRAAERWRERGGRIDCVAEPQSADGLATALEPQVGGRRVLLPQSSIALGILERRLCDAGAYVDAITAYTTQADRDGALDAWRRIAGGDVDVVIVTSPSSVRALADSTPSGVFDRVRAVTWLSVGPTTTAALEHAGFPAAVEARDPSPAGLAGSISDTLRHLHG